MARMKRRSDGRYCRTFSMDGKRYYVYSKSQKDLSEAVERKKEEIRQRNAGLQQDHDNPVVNDVFKMFIESLRTHDKESTLCCRMQQYGTLKNIKIVGGGKLGETRVQSVTVADAEMIQNALVTRGLKAGTINLLMSLMKQVFYFAITHDFIEKNPCRTIKNIPPEGAQARTSIHRALNSKEIDAFIKGAEKRHSLFLPLFIFALSTGMRIGEIAGLTEDEIHDGKVYIVRTASIDEIGNRNFQTPKTPTSKRCIELSQDAKKALDMQRILLASLSLEERPCRIKTEGAVPRMPTLFCDIEGNILKTQDVDREIARICKSEGIQRFTSHAFRSTFATCYMDTYPDSWKSLQAILGHASAKMTLDLYTHDNEEKTAETMKKFKILA